MEYESVAHETTERELGHLPSGSGVTVTVHRYSGGSGPTVYVQAAQHGIELNGPAALRRLHERLLRSRIAGTDVVVPVVNALALDHRSYITPPAYDAVNSNLNRVWPGDDTGSLQERLAAQLWELVTDADAVVDLHTGLADMLEHVRYQEEDREARRLATAFRTEYLIVDRDGTPEDSARIMRAAFQAGYEGNWFVTQDQTNQEFLDLVDERITDGILGLAEADSPEAGESGRIEAFTRAVKEYSGEEPGLFAKNTYDAMTVVGLSMRAAADAEGEVSREAVATNVPAVANPPGEAVTDYESGASAAAGGDVDYEGLVGPVNFDENGDIRSPFAVMRAEGSEWTRASVLPSDELE